MNETEREKGLPPWLWMVLLMVALTLGANVALVVIAYRGRPDLERRDYYQAGLDYQRVIDERRTSETSWHLEPSFESDGRLRLCLRDGDAPLSGAHLRLHLGRPDDARADRSLERVVPAGGCLTLDLPLRHGAWNLLVRAEHAGTHARFEERLWAP